MEAIKNWKLEARNLSKKAQAAEKDIAKLFIFNQTTDLKPKIDRVLDDFHKQGLTRSQEQAYALNKLTGISKGVSELKQLLKFYEKKNEYLIKVQKLSEGVVNELDAFRDEMAAKFSQSAEIEEALLADLQILEMKVDQIQSGQEPKPQIAQNDPGHHAARPETGKQNRKAINKPEKQIAPEQKADPLMVKLNKVQQSLSQKTIQVESVERQIASLGKNYGWPEDDHTDFLLIWNRRKGNNYFELQDQCTKYFRLYTNEQIHTHIDKHRRFLELHQAKKELLYEYKMLKEQKRDTELKIVQRKEEQEEKERERDRKPVEIEKELQQRKEKLLQWRLMKEAKKEAEIIKVKEEQERIKQQKARNAKEIQQRRAMLNQWKQQQEKIQQQEKKPQPPKRVQSALNRQAAERVKQREQEMIRKKIQMHKAKQQAEYERLKKQEQLKEKKFVKYSYVNSKLEEKTTAMKEKQRQKFDGKNPKEANTFGGVIGIGAGRAVPSWRQGI